MLRDLTKVLKSLSDGTRVRIVKMLQEKPMCVCELTEVLGLAFSTVSKHLSILRDAGFIEDTKAGRWVEYRLSEEARNEFAIKLLPLINNWLSSDKQIVADREKAAATTRAEIYK